MRRLGEVMGAAGRFGDTKAAHVALGEVVIHPDQMTPRLYEVLSQEFSKQGIPLGGRMVGHPQGNTNPLTGAQEFFDFGGWDGGSIGQDDGYSTGEGGSVNMGTEPSASYDGGSSTGQGGGDRIDMSTAPSATYSGSTVSSYDGSFQDPYGDQGDMGGAIGDTSGSYDGGYGTGDGPDLSTDIRGDGGMSLIDAFTPIGLQVAMDGSRPTGQRVAGGLMTGIGMMGGAPLAAVGALGGLFNYMGFEPAFKDGTVMSPEEMDEILGLRRNDDNEALSVTSNQTLSQMFQPPPGFSRPGYMDAPGSLGFDPNMDDLQKRTAIATGATQGDDRKWRTQDAQEYYDYLLRGALVNEQGGLNDLSALVPIDLQYLTQTRGLNNPSTTRGLLDALASA